MPTLIDFAGGTYPETHNGKAVQPMEGISLVSVLKGKEVEREAPLFWEHEGNRAVRSGDWKLVSAFDYRAGKFKEWELYNIADDRSELVDLSGQHPEIVDRMVSQYEEWSERAGVVSREVIIAE